MRPYGLSSSHNILILRIAYVDYQTLRRLVLSPCLVMSPNLALAAEEDSTFTLEYNLIDFYDKGLLGDDPMVRHHGHRFKEANLDDEVALDDGSLRLA